MCSVILRIGPVNIERRAIEALRAAVSEAPGLTVLDIEAASEIKDSSVDLIGQVNFDGRRHVPVGEVKSNGQPRHVPGARLQLKKYVDRQEGPNVATPMFIAPTLSEDARALCVDNEVADRTAFNTGR